MPTIVHFDLPADDPERARAFYEELFNWRFEFLPTPMPYYLIETTDLNGNPGIGGGMAKRGAPEQVISNYIGVESIDECIEKVVKLGGKIFLPKTPVPAWGYLAVCLDTENNTFGLWEENIKSVES
jgi:predicted enzyme related to lactoylglutathione lyase